MSLPNIDGFYRFIFHKVGLVYSDELNMWNYIL